MLFCVRSGPDFVLSGLTLQVCGAGDTTIGICGPRCLWKMKTFPESESRAATIEMVLNGIFMVF